MFRSLAPALCLAMALAACASPGPMPPPSPAAFEHYRLDTGDTLRVDVFAQSDLTNSYTVDASGEIAMPLIGSVPARGLNTDELENAIAYDLRNGYLRDPSVSVQVETYRPFYILGEVNSPGSYPYVASMTGETAAAIAGGFTDRARKRTVTVTRRINGRAVRGEQPASVPLLPGDTVHVGERFF